MEVLSVMALFGFFCIGSFIVGARVGQAVVKREPIPATIPNPIKAIEEYKEEQGKIATMMDNINNYDGTGLGQKDI